MTLTIKADGTRIKKWHVDATFAVHCDFKSHTGGIMTLGAVAIQKVSTKQKVNTKRSTEAEYVSLDDVILKSDVDKIVSRSTSKENIINRDNQSSMKLEMNGKISSSKRKRHFNIKYFLFLTQSQEKFHFSSVQLVQRLLIL
jgi:hypothetical protein